MNEFREFLLNGEQVLVNVSNITYIENIDVRNARIHFVGTDDTLDVDMKARDVLTNLQNPYISGLSC